MSGLQVQQEPRPDGRLWRSRRYRSYQAALAVKIRSTIEMRLAPWRFMP